MLISATKPFRPFCCFEDVHSVMIILHTAVFSDTSSSRFALPLSDFD